jgi:Protein of unknown function (DUF3277).
MNRVDTFDPKDVSVIVGGRIIEGFGEDIIEIMRDSDQIGDDAGADGDVARWVTNDRRGTVRITLLQTSRSNLYLSSLAIADELTGNVLVPVIVKDNRGNDLHVAPNAWVKKMPDVKYKRGIEMRVWELRTSHLNMVVGGAA